MSFYITLKTLKFQGAPLNKNQKISIVIKSHNKKLLTFSSKFSQKINWQESFVAESNERQIQLILVKQIIPKKKVKRISTNFINMNKYLFEGKQHNLDRILFNNQQGKNIGVLELQILYKKNKKFIGPIQFFKRGINQYDQEQDVLQEIQQENSKNSFFKWNFFGLNQNKNTKSKQTVKTSTSQPQHIIFYKGPHVSRNLFSFCDTVYDDQEFTIVQHDYNDQN